MAGDVSADSKTESFFSALVLIPCCLYSEVWLISVHQGEVERIQLKLYKCALRALAED